MNPPKKTLLPLILLIALLAALAGTAGYIVHLHRVNAAYVPAVSTPKPTASFLVPTAAAATAVPDVTVSPVPAADATETPAWQFTEDAAQFWSEGALRLRADSYRSPSLSIDVRTVVDGTTFSRQAVYYVADIYVRDVTQIRTENSKSDFSRSGHADVVKMAQRVNAILAISGDYYSAQSGSLVIRNGVVYRKSLREDMDVCMLLRDGTMETVTYQKASLKAILEKDPWQAWQFGPALLNADGTARKSFPGNTVTKRNPRSCIGYIAPGHYLFVAVDGRQKQSGGLKMTELAALMESLGCKQAFNLDGGASAHFYWQDRIYSNPSGGGRQISDIIYIAKEDYPDSIYFHGKDGLHR